jgi:hypothetical protein
MRLSVSSACGSSSPDVQWESRIEASKNRLKVILECTDGALREVRAVHSWWNELNFYVQLSAKDSHVS